MKFQKVRGMLKHERSGEWFHGGPRITDWSNMRWDRDRSESDLNAEGPGMYWTTDLEEAASYAHGGGALYIGRMLPGFRHFPKGRPTLKALERLYWYADEDSQEIFLSNWSIEYPGSASAIRSVLTKYARQNTLFDAFVTLYHDLFRYDADAYVGALRDMKFDGHVIGKGETGGSRKRKHLILWNPRAMEIWHP